MSGNGDYISREAANEACLKAVRRCSLSLYNGIMVARGAILKLSAADVRPVVLCRDCMLRQYCKVAQYLGEDGFCSNGEKREES